MSNFPVKPPGGSRGCYLISWDVSSQDSSIIANISSISPRVALDFLRLVFNWLRISATSGKSLLAAADFSEFSPDRRASSDFRFSISVFRFSISASWHFSSSNCSDTSSFKFEISWLAAASREFSSEISWFFLMTRRSLSASFSSSSATFSSISGLNDSSAGVSLRPSIFPGVPPSLLTVAG